MICDNCAVDISITSKLPDVGTTIFTVMSQMANEYGAINLAQGFPDFEPPQALLDRVTHHLNAGANQYAPMPGDTDLRVAIAKKTERVYGAQTDPDTQVTITVGATEALFSAIACCVHPGDEVIVFDPAYDSYEPAIRLAGGITRHLPLSTPTFSIDWPVLEACLNARTRLLIINSPHNPTGAMLSRDDLARLGQMLEGTNTLVLSDEVYEHIVFDGRTHTSAVSVPELAARAFVVSSFGKTYHATGWKIGYLIAPPALTHEFRKVHQFVPFTVCSPMQKAYAEFVRSTPEHYLGLGQFYQRKREHFAHLLSDSRLQLLPVAGSYFQLVDYSRISDEDDMSFARRLTCDIGVAAIPISVFYEHPPRQTLVRFCFAKDDDTLARAAEKLCKI